MSFKFYCIEDKKLQGVKILKNSHFRDKRGYLYSLFSSKNIQTLIKKKFSNVEDKIVIRKKRTLTGIHGDSKTWKIISCLDGVIQLVLVNCNKKSKNFGDYKSIILKGLDFKSILIPPQIGNSYLCLSSKAIIYYKMLYNGKYSDVKNQFTYSWKDSNFKIKWLEKKPILSNRDNV